MSNLALNLVASAARIPDRTAAITSAQTMTYAELERASARLATLLQREGIGVGDRVGVMLPNIAAAPIAYYGIWADGRHRCADEPVDAGAAVVLKAGIVAEDLRQFVRGRVAAYKYPRRIWFVDSLPTGPTGKLLRREVIPPPTEEA
jgi:acyl-CoA synthetase (AMP-forming)/AMP-acid ligase II